MSDYQKNKIAVGISSCLLGERVRFDGGHKRHSYVTDTLGEYFDFQPFCPEMAIGMGVPRETIRLVEENQKIYVRGVKDASLDVTDALTDCANQRQDWHNSLCGYILKKDSPSCGMERVKVYRHSLSGNTVPEKKGVGQYAAAMMKNCPWLPVEEEGRLGDAVIRENFIQRVYVIARWRQMVDEGLSWSQLMTFHARHKLIYYSHNQNLARDLGRALASASKDAKQANVESFAQAYLHSMMELLRIKATRANHVNTLQHVRGYLKKSLDADDKRELNETIENYRLGYLPLIVPLTLLKHHFLKYPDPYIADSWYMQPHPGELMLRNTI